MCASVNSIIVLFMPLVFVARTQSATIERLTVVTSGLNHSQAGHYESDNCSKHSDCNPILRHLLDVMNQEGETNQNRNRQELKAFQTLHRNPKIFCVHSKCRCFDGKYSFDPSEQICRQLCTQNEECDFQMSVEIPRGDPMMIGPDDDMSGLEKVAQFCASDGMCRCPPESMLDTFNHHQCISTVRPFSGALFSTSFTIGTIILLLAITVVPIWTMVQKHRTFNRQRQSQHTALHARLETKQVESAQ